MLYSKSDFIAILRARKKPMKWRFRRLGYMVDHNRRMRERGRGQSRTMRIPRHHKRDRGYALKEMDHLSDATFHRMFRMSRTSFLELQERIHPDLQFNDQKATNAAGSPISTRTRLAMTLRWLAGGIYIDICFAFGVATSTFYSERGVLWPTVGALDKILTIGYPIDDPIALEQ